MAHERMQLGKRGEQLVANYLKTKGFAIRAMNYTRRCGEIDIIAEKDDTRIFVEVKLRQKKYFPTSQVITKSKQNKIIQAARRYNFELQKENNADESIIYRFDVALLEPAENKFRLMYIPNAFTHDSEGFF